MIEHTICSSGAKINENFDCGRNKMGSHMWSKVNNHLECADVYLD